jgi:hypothetical protein
MMNKMTSTLASAVALALSVSACDIEQTEEGELPEVDVSGSPGQLPEYEVDVRQTQEGRMPDVDIDVEEGNLPEYDVDMPNVELGTSEMDVEVPDIDVDMETEQVTVPDVEITMPDDPDYKDDDPEDDTEGSGS